MAKPQITLSVRSGQTPLTVGKAGVIVDVTGDIAFSGLAIGDFTLPGGSVTAVGGSGTAQTATLTLPATAGSVTLTLSAGAVYDTSESDTVAATNQNLAATLVIIVVPSSTTGVRAVAAKSFGSNVLGIIGAQPAFGSRITSPLTTADPPAVNVDAGMLDKVIEFRPPFTLMPSQEFYLADRMKGNPSPDDMVEGMKAGGGLAHFYADALQGGFWIKHLLGGIVTTMPFSPSPHVVATGLSLSGSSAPYTIRFTTVDQPKDLMETLRVAKTAPIPPYGLDSLKLTFSATVPDGTTMDIVGRDLNNSQLRETVTFTSGTAEARRYYSELRTGSSTVQITGLGITGVTDLYDHVVSFTREIGNGLSLEVHEGNIDLPITYADLFVTGGSVVLENVARMLFRTFAHEVYPRESLAGNYGAGTDITPFGRFELSQIPKWGMALEIVSEDYPAMNRVYPVEMVGFNLNQTIAPPATSNAGSLFYPKIVRKGNRDVGWNAVVDHTLEADFDQFVGGPRFRSVITAVSKPFGGRYSGIVFEGDRTQMISFPRRIITNLGEVKQMITGRLTGRGGLGNNEASMRVISPMAIL